MFQKGWQQPAVWAAKQDADQSKEPFSRSRRWNVPSPLVLFTFSHRFQHQSEANQDRCLHVLSVVEHIQSLGISQRKDGFLAHRCGGCEARVSGCIWWMTLGLPTAMWKGQGQAGTWDQVLGWCPERKFLSLLLIRSLSDKTLRSLLGTLSLGDWLISWLYPWALPRGNQLSIWHLERTDRTQMMATGRKGKKN